MRKFILITAMVLASASAQAGSTRSLTLASNEPPPAAEAPKAVEAPAYVARPAPVGSATEAPETTKPLAEKPARTTSTDKPKRRRESTEDRVIRELNRHGIYW